MTSLLFDLDGVLLRPKTVAGKRRVEQVIGTDDHIWETYEDLRPAYDAADVSDERFWRQVQLRADLDPFDYSEAIVADWEASLHENTEMVELVTWLIDEGWRCGVLANMPPGLGERARENLSWLGKLEAVTLSGDIGVAKPDRRAFAVGVDAMGASARDTVFFDDRPDYVAAAEEFGLRAVLFEGPQSVLEVVQA